MAQRVTIASRSCRPWARCTTGTCPLVKLARKKADRVVVSIFVNPTQFAPNEDLARYPRDEAGDVAKLQAAGPTSCGRRASMKCTPTAFRRASRRGARLPLEGEFRPHHFGGVATVCCKLFSQVTPDIAIFGEKDYPAALRAATDGARSRSAARAHRRGDKAREGRPRPVVAQRLSVGQERNIAPAAQRGDFRWRKRSARAPIPSGRRRGAGRSSPQASRRSTTSTRATPKRFPEVRSKRTNSAARSRRRLARQNAADR